MEPLLVLMDLEGCLIPEIWIHVAEKTGIPELKKTTRDISDYDELMKMRISVLDRSKLTLPDIQKLISEMDVLPGAPEFIAQIRELGEFIILSDTYYEFAKPLMKRLGYPTLFCHHLLSDTSGKVTDYKLRVKDSKAHATRRFKENGFYTIAAGDSFNDVSMLQNADKAAWFHAPQNIVERFPMFPSFNQYDELYKFVKQHP